MFFVFFGMLCLGQAKGKEYSFAMNEKKAAVRRVVLQDYDRIIGPVKYGKTDYLTIEFNLVVLKLIELNTKAETLKIDGWVKQRWLDGIIKWDSSKVNNTCHTRFSPHEIWVPDVALMNNADPNEHLSGGPTKFVTHVGCACSGICSWVSPVTFTSSCKLNVKYWPMDTQVCTMTFGSWTFAYKHLRLKPIKFKYKKGSISNGEWTIDDIETYTRKEGRPRAFSTLNYKFTLTRKPTYAIFYLTPPAIILVILAVLSYFIPTDSGERISFVMTILLAKMVFLLMMPEYLPKTSDEIPILGVLLILSMVLVAVVLTGTIFVLACHHKEGKPPMAVQKLLFPFKFVSAMKNPFPRIKVGLMKTIKKMIFPFKFLSKKLSFRAADGFMNQRMENEMQEAHPDDIAPSTYNDPDVEPQSVEEEEITWQDIAMKLNWIFFFIIVTVLAMTALAVYMSY